MVAETSEADLDLLDFPLKADGQLGAAVEASLVDDPPQKGGLLLPDVEDRAKPAMDIGRLGPEQLPHREEVAVPAVKRQLASPRQERKRVSAVGAFDPEGEVRRSSGGFHGCVALPKLGRPCGVPAPFPVDRPAE